MAILPPDPVYILRGDMGPVHSLLFKISPYAEHLYTGAETGIIHIWDLQKNREIGRLERHEMEMESMQQCLSMQAFGDEELIIQRKCGSYDFWRSNGSSWSISKSIETDYYGFSRFEELTEELLLLPLQKSCVGIFSLKTHEIVRKLEPSKVSLPKELGEVMTVKNCKLENKNVVIVGYESGVVASWDVDSMSVNNWLKYDSCPMTVCFDSHWMRGIIGSPADKLDVFNLTKNYELVQKTTIPLKNSGTSVLATRIDSKVFAAGCWDARVRIYSWKTLRPLVVLDQHRSTIFDVTYSKDKVEAYNNKNIMAATGKDGTVSLWDIYNQ